MKPKSIYKMILEGDDIRWQTVIYELVRAGKVDPWNLDISKLTREYIKVLRNLERMNFKLSGKVVLAAAVLLKLKTRELGMVEFVQHAEGVYEDEDVEALEADTEEEQAILAAAKQYAPPQLVSKIPTSRTRPVTVFELMGALKKAIVVQERRVVRHEQRKEDAKPRKHKIHKVDIYKKIQRVYGKIKELSYTSKSNVVEFDHLVRSDSAKARVWTFVPLLHLANDEKVSLHQETPFGKIFVEMKKE